MMKVFVSIFFTLFSLSLALSQTGPSERNVLNECLASYGGLTPENGRRLERYKQWSDSYEEIPCFTDCYLSKMLGIYNNVTGFNEDRVIEKFGRFVFEECKHRLRTYGREQCQLAYTGFHCLVSLEDDPFILIDSTDKTSSEAKSAMKGCLRKFESFEWPRIHEYNNFPVREPLPCFTECFLEELQVFDENTRRWNIEKMRFNLGIPKATANFNSCLAMRRRRNQNSCAWMYKEMVCFALSQ